VNKGQAYMRDIASLGCIVCRKTGRGRTPAEAHHLLRGGRQIDDFHTIPLCVPHHRAGLKTQEFVSRHPWRKEFEARYGTEYELLALTQAVYREEIPQ
jgi:hypothetical protein